MFVLVLFELPTYCLHSFIRNWVVLNKEDGESFFSLPLLLCFGEKNIDRMYKCITSSHFEDPKHFVLF